MRRKVLITITDARRFRQFTLGQIMRWLIALAGLALIGAMLAGWGYAKWLERQNAESIAVRKRLEEQLVKMEMERSRLQLEIDKRQEALARMGDRLDELEVLVGVKPGTTFSTPERLTNVTLSAVQLALLFSIVPNGDPLPMKGVTSAFGWRMHPTKHRRSFHSGIDLRAKTHKPVWTTADGVVEYAAYDRGSGYGNLVIIDHGFGFKTYYGHLHKFFVKKGDTVVKGDLIALSGNSGRSTAPHLHYEIRFLKHPLNPYWFMKWKKSEYRMIFKHIKGVPWESLIALVSHLASKTIPPSSRPDRK
jgi:murein DD-endopeptidase MepM/ murein hydrolase activator NlpD